MNGHSPAGLDKSTLTSGRSTINNGAIKAQRDHNTIAEKGNEKMDIPSPDTTKLSDRVSTTGIGKVMDSTTEKSSDPGNDVAEASDATPVFELLNIAEASVFELANHGIRIATCEFSMLLPVLVPN